MGSRMPVMAIEPPAMAGGRPPSCLRIHIDGAAVAPHSGLLPWLRQWLSAPLVLSQPAELHIDDLQGHPVFRAEGSTSPIELALPPGTYHVTVHGVGSGQRRYTVTLEQGRAFELHLPAPARR